MSNPGVQEAAGRAPFKSGRFDNVVFTIGAEDTNVINVGIQLRNGDKDVNVRCNFDAYISDDANGDSIAGTAPSVGIDIGTDGLLVHEVVANKAMNITSEADGDVDLDIEEIGADTWFLVVVLPDGSLSVSGAITFAA